MPHLDASFNPVTDNDKTAHKCIMWVSMSSAKLTRQLRACTDGSVPIAMIWSLLSP